MMDKTDVWVLTRTHEDVFYDDCNITTIVCGVFTSLEAAKIGANTSTLSMSSKDGIQWENDKWQGAKGVVKVCPKDDYYMFCKCKSLDEWEYGIQLCYLGDEMPEETVQEMRSA